MRNEELIVSHMKYAFGIVNTRCRIAEGNIRDSELEDVLSEALLALSCAGDRFDAARGVHFKQFVQYRIVGALNSWLTSRKQRYGLSGMGRPSREQASSDWRSQRLQPWKHPFSEVNEDNGGTEAIAGSETVILLRAALEALPRRLSYVLVRRYCHEETVETIGDSMGLTPGRVSQLTMSGLRLIRKELELRGVRKVADLV